MEKFSRYVNKENELFIVINKWADVQITDDKPKVIPTTVDLLDVAKEKLVTIGGQPLKVADLENRIKTGLLRKIK